MAQNSWDPSVFPYQICGNTSPKFYLGRPPKTVESFWAKNGCTERLVDFTWQSLRQEQGCVIEKKRSQACRCFQTGGTGAVVLGDVLQ